MSRTAFYESVDRDGNFDFTPGLSTHNVTLYKNLTGGDGWEFARSRPEAGSAQFFPLANQWCLGQIMRVFVLNNSSLYRRLWWALEKLPLLVNFVKGYNVNKVFPNKMFLFGLTCVSY